ncbi:hypothetical protein DEFDS_2038 [Deferribacter desulfuricans SSM1]|uniref:Uncharacterized protein n=1 Tax=Deferribacter desulfuricans (strain DSM 14783 / JCM 11476 / NBRC 101012 / SSM1) TaxID=639282 RepID=D3P9U8_DEFDS|nr:HmuY family protein [Deferribacter desulfuricans]BAI81488.1 hypothetical protein DEFDS_2038 [Deferribacter desulfuricans SSM1]
MFFKIFKMIVIILVNILIVCNGYSFDENYIKKMAIDNVKDELHSQLEDLVGTDIPVESILQGLDHLYYGEIKKAKLVLTEEALKQLIGVLVGSSAGTILTTLWDIDKAIFTSIQKWGEDQDRKIFYESFLKEQIKIWKTGNVPKWQVVAAQLNNWFNENEFFLGRIKLYSERKTWAETLKSEMWAKTLEIHTKYKKYFYLKKKLQEAAKRAKENFEWKVLLVHINYKKIARLLELAQEKVTKENIEKYQKNKNYRILVNRVAHINSLTKQRFTINDYLKLLKRFDKVNLKQIKEAISSLQGAQLPANLQNIRFYLTDFRYKSFVDKLRKDKKESEASDDTVKKVASSLMNIKSNEFIELVSNSNKSLTLLELVNQINDRIKNITKNNIKNGTQIQIKVSTIVNPLINYYRESVSNYLANEISFSTLINTRHKILQYCSDLLFEYQNILEKGAIYSDVFNEFVKQILYLEKDVVNIRYEKFEQYIALKKEICNNDNILEKLGKIQKEIAELQKENSVDLGLIKLLKAEPPFEHDTRSFKLLSGWDKLSSDYVKKTIPKIEKNINNLNINIKTISLKSSYLKSELQKYYLKEVSLIDKLNNFYIENSNFLDGFPLIQGSILFNGFDSVQGYNDKRLIDDSCKIDVLNHYKVAVNKLTEFENRLFDLQLALSENKEYLPFIESQLKYNESLNSLISYDTDKDLKYLKQIQEYEKESDNASLLFSKIDNLYERGLKDLNSNFIPYEDVIKYVKNESIKNKLNIPFSALKGFVDKTETNFNKCKEVNQKNDILYKEINFLRDSTINLAKNIKLWMDGNHNRFSGFLNVTSGKKAGENRCLSLENKLIWQREFIDKYEKIQNDLVVELSKPINSAYNYQQLIYKAEILPFIPIFDINQYKQKLANYIKNTTVYSAPKIDSIYYNKRKVYERVRVSPINLENGEVKFVVDVSSTCADEKCKPKEVSISYEKNKWKRCKKVSNNRFVCIYKPKINSGVYVAFVAKNLTNNASKERFINVVYKDYGENLTKYLKSFENDYNRGKSIYNYFPRGSTIAENYSLIADKNRKEYPHKLVFQKFRLLNFKDFEKDVDNTIYKAKVSTTWKLSGKINKNGSSIFNIDCYESIGTQKKFCKIKQIEGDTFIFEVKNNRNKNITKQVKIGIISHVPGKKKGGYSIDFETGKYFNSEKDLAAGFVNPKVKGYDKPYFNVGNIKDMGVINFKALKSCPKYGYSDYYSGMRAIERHVYCVRTLEGNYVKIEVLETGGSMEKAYIKFRWQFLGR